MYVRDAWASSRPWIRWMAGIRSSLYSRSHVPFAMHIPRAKYYIQRRKVNLREEKGESPIDSCTWKIYFRKILILCLSLVKKVYCHVCLLISNHADIFSLWMNYINTGSFLRVTWSHEIGSSMKFREKKLRTHDATPAVQSSESQESPTRERERRLTFADKDARLFSASQRSSYARVRMYACAHVVTSTHTRRFIAGATSRFHDLHVSFLARIAMRVWCALFFSRPGLLGSPYSFFLFFFYFCLRHRFRSRCATNFDYVRRKRPWSHAAIGRAQRKRDRRLARRREDDGRSWTEPSRAELSRYTRPG